MVDLSIITNIWNIIVESNAFNFIIFVSVLALLFKKINLGGMISSLQEKIVKVLDEVNDNKNEAEGKLSEAKKSIENLSVELGSIVANAEKSAEVISNKILAEAQAQLESIEANAKKAIEAEEKLLVANLTKKTSQTSVEVAKNHIQQTLASNPTMHEKYINESIDELDKLNW